MRRYSNCGIKTPMACIVACGCVYSMMQILLHELNVKMLRSITFHLDFTEVIVRSRWFYCFTPLDFLQCNLLLNFAFQ